MYPRYVAANGNVRSKLVQLASDGKRSPNIGHERESVWSCLNRMGNHKGFVEPRFQNCHARARDRGVARAVGGMQRRTFRKCHRKKVGPVLAVHGGHGG